MELSLGFIAESLKEQGYDISRCESSAENNYALPRLYIAPNKMEDNCLYIVDGETLPENPYLGKNVAVISIGEPPEAFSGQRCSLLVIEQKESLLTLYAAVVDVYRKYGGWVRELERLVESKASLPAYLDITYPLVQNTVSIHDAVTVDHPLAIIPDKTPDGTNFMKAIAGLNPSWIMQNLQTDLTQRKPYLTNYEFQGVMHQTLVYNLFDEEAFIGQINISDSFQPLRKSDFWIIQELGKRIRRVFIEDQKGQMQKIKSFRSTFAELLADTYVEPARLERRAKRIGYQIDDQYVMVSLKYVSDYARRVPQGMISKQIQQQIPGSTALQFESELALLFNLTYSRSKVRDVIRKLSTLLPGGKCMIGISDLYKNLADTKWYYKEAVLAIGYGTEDGEKPGFFRFADHIQDHLLHYGTSVLPAKLLCMREVLELYELDQKNGSSFCDTLRVCYKNHMNITHSAEELHVHRSTLLYRLDRIRQILDMDTTDYEKLLYINVSLVLCEEMEREESAK